VRSKRGRGKEEEGEEEGEKEGEGEEVKSKRIGRRVFI
jgi:hypothetical protein